MKRTAALVIIIGLIVAGRIILSGALPFMPVFGTSMEPVFKAGSLITIEEVSPSQVKVGDIIVFEVPPAVREYYNYPPVVAHRVIKVNKETMTFRTKGDNTGEDPFTVRGQDIKGRTGQQIPLLGFPLLFLQSRQGLIFTIVGVSLFALYLYSAELGRSKRRAQRGIFAPVIEESRRTTRVLEQRLTNTEKGMAGTQEALNSFASAIEVYAEHLKSHTTAIQGLSEASQELKKGAADQNAVLSRLTEVMGQTRPARAEEVTPEVEKIKFPPGCIRSRRQPDKEGEIFRAG